MNNHEHLYVETPAANLSAGMQHLNGSYTSYFNRRHRRIGHLFQGRFKAVLIENEGHYWEVSRYIHLNPVRAKLADRPEAWRWSSYPGYHRRSRELQWVTYRGILREFGRSADKARRAYRRYVAAGVQTTPTCPWNDAAGGLILGDEGFVDKIRGMLDGRVVDPSLPALETLRPRPTLKRIAEAVASEFGASPADWSPGRRHDDAARAVAAYLARRRYGYPARKVAKALGYASHGGVVAAIRRVDSANPSLMRTAKKLARNLTND